MNKGELVDAITANCGEKVTKKQVEAFLKSYQETISAELRKGEKVTIIGFGTFAATKRAEREGRNPATGAKITIPASVTVRFTPGSALKSAMNV